jgi:type VI secretion system secreted protein Hcp
VEIQAGPLPPNQEGIQMAGDMFLKLEGLDGESVDEASPSHKKEIDIIGWSFGGTNPASFALGQGGQQSKPVYTDFHITKVCDSSSVKLLRAMTGGQHIDKGKITCRKAIKDSNKLEYLTIDLDDVQVTGVQFSGSGHDQFLHETVSLTAAKFKAVYTLQDDDGNAGPKTELEYDLQKQKVV